MAIEPCAERPTGTYHEWHPCPGGAPDEVYCIFCLQVVPLAEGRAEVKGQIQEHRMRPRGNATGPLARG